MARKRYNFWLDDKRADDWPVNDLITKLKAAGQFTRAIREGLRLWVDLRANRTDVLYELFPHMKPQVSGGGAGGDGSDTARIAAMLELFMAEQKQKNGYVMQSALPAPVQGTGNLKGLKAIAAPTFEDDDLPMIVTSEKKVDGLQIAKNLVGSVLGLRDDPVIKTTKSNVDSFGNLLNAAASMKG